MRLPYKLSGVEGGACHTTIGTTRSGDDGFDCLMGKNCSEVDFSLIFSPFRAPTLARPLLLLVALGEAKAYCPFRGVCIS